jgi:hypothetical protein
MHVEANLLDDIGDVGAGERQVLEGPSEAPEVSRISNRRPRLDRDLGLRPSRFTSSLKNVETKLTLSDEELVSLMLYGDS